jgi:hypothetical protein
LDQVCREPRDGSFKEPEKPAPAAVIQLTEDEMIKKTHAILDEYLHLQDIKVSCQEFYRGRYGRDRMVMNVLTDEKRKPH